MEKSKENTEITPAQDAPQRLAWHAPQLFDITQARHTKSGGDTNDDATNLS